MRRPELENLNPLEIDAEGRFRKDFGELDDLRDSIRDKGILQPITVRKVDGAKPYKLLAGGRRLAAVLQEGLPFIPALIRVESASEEVDVAVDNREIELLENIERKDFTWQERCKLVNDINKLYREKHKGDWSGRKTANLLGRSHGGVNRQLQLASAINAMPRLGLCKTEDDAFKQLKVLEEKVVLQELAKRMEGESTLLEEGITKGEIDAETIEASPSKEALKFYNYAKGHYIIGDALEGLREYIELQGEGKSPIYYIDCDPPFGIDLLSQKRTEDSKEELAKYIEIASEGYIEFLASLCPLLYAAAGQHCWMTFWFGSTWDREVRNALRSANWHVDDIPAVWVKGEEEGEGSGQTASPDRYLARATEFFYVCRKGNPIFHKEGTTNIFAHKPVPPKRKYHPTQKPISLYRAIMETFALPSSVTLVPFLGSGAALKAAYSLGSTGFGWDLNEENVTPFLVTLGELVENDWEE